MILGVDVTPRAELTKTGYYNDFARHFGITRVMSGVIRRDGVISSSISTQRGDDSEEFTEHERALTQTLMPHLYRALQIHRRVCGLEQHAGALVEALDHLPSAIVLSRADARIVFANRAATALMNRADGLASKRGALVAAGSDQTRALHSFIRGSGGPAPGVEPGGALLLRRPSGRTALRVLVTPLRMNPSPLCEELPIVAVFIVDPESGPHVSEDALRRAWGLTPIEAAITSLLARGHRVTQIAVTLRLTPSTARWHVKRVLAKSGATHQADLVRLVFQMPGVTEPTA